MDHKPSRPKATNIISFLPTRTSFTVRYHPHSPGAAEASAAKMKNLHSRGFSGPFVSIVPMEARRKEKNGAGSNADTQEPTSPKVSCIGQINHKKKAAGRSKNPPTEVPNKHEKKETKKKLSSSSTAEKQKKRSSAFSIVRKIIFGRKAPPAPDAGTPDVARGRDPVKQKFPGTPVMAPSLGQMKRFASGRDTLGSFDWKKMDMMREKAAVAEEEEESGRDRFNWYSDEEVKEDDVIIPHSAPIMIGGGGVVALEPKKEVNIWKRRTFAPVTPLQLS